MAMAVGGEGATAEHQRHSADRRTAGAADHLHGDHAAHAQGTGRAGAAAATSESAAARYRQDRTVVIIIDKDKKMMLNTEPTDETRLGERLKKSSRPAPRRSCS